MMMEQCGYGMAMGGGYTHVPEYIEGYPESPYGGSMRERAEDAGPQGIYERRAIESGSGWDRTPNDSGRKTSNHHPSSHTISNMDDGPYIQQKLSSAPGRAEERGGGGGAGGGGVGHEGGGGRGRGGGRGHGSAGEGLSPERPLLMAVDAEGGDTFDLRPHFTGSSHLQPLQPTRSTCTNNNNNAVDDQFTFVDWRNYAPSTPGQYYPLLHESKKYGDIGDFAERNAHPAAYLPTHQAELYDCPPVAATYPAGLYPGSGQALPYCQPSPPGTTTMSDGWHGGSSSVASDDVQLSVDETEKRRNPYRAAAAAAAIAAAAVAAAAQTAEPRCSSGHRSPQLNRYPSTSSSSLASSSRRGSEVGAPHPAVPLRRLQGGGGSSHQRRWHHSDLTETFLDEDERKLRERDRKKKDNHNLIERKRRLNINANIQVLGTLLPPSSSVSLPKDSTQNKGNILRAAVDFVQSAQQKIERLQLTEHRLRDLQVTNRRLRCIIEELETYIRAAGLYDDYIKTVGDKDSPPFTHSSPVTFDAVKEEMNFSPASLQRQESDVTDDCTGG